MAYEGHRCLTEDEAIGIAQGIMEGEQVRLVADHLQDCDRCRNLVAVNQPDEIDEIFENIVTLLEADDRLKEYRRK